MQTSTDVFAKAREHERSAVLTAAREADVLPYFHLLTSPAMPVVEMEGAERIMLGSNNYLGLTGDPRVKAAARDALERYGTALTGSRFLNGTIPLHVEILYNEYQSAAAFAVASLLALLALVTLVAKRVLEWQIARKKQS